MTKQNPEKLFLKVTQFVDDSNALIQRGALMELNEFNDTLDELYREIQALTDAERIENAEKLQQVVASLQQLLTGMHAAKDEIGKLISNASQNKKAHIAYQKTEVSDKKI